MYHFHEASLGTLECWSHKVLVDTLEFAFDHSWVHMCCMAMEALDSDLVTMNSIGSHVAFLPSLSQQDKNTRPLHD